MSDEIEGTKPIATRVSEKLVVRRARRIKEKDIKRAFAKIDEIKRKFTEDGPLGRFVEDAKLLFGLLQDYWNRRYREIPYQAIGAVVFGLLYVLNPFDLIPDMIPGVGLLDDAAVMAICLGLVERELEEYKAWKQRQDEA